MNYTPIPRAWLSGPGPGIPAGLFQAAGVTENTKPMTNDIKPSPGNPIFGMLPDSFGSTEYPMPTFEPWPKMARLSRECVITEKIDGTNAQVFITEDGQIFAGSRTRWITPADDNYGFARWVEANKAELLTLGPGRHFGEWWGAGIQRRYGLTEKRFSLFNTLRWAGCPDKNWSGVQCRIDGSPGPKCCHVVPVIYRGPFDSEKIQGALILLQGQGSVAAPGFLDPEGIVIYHVAAGVAFKKTILNDESPKSQL